MHASDFVIGRAPYTDAELYRLMVAQMIEVGSATCKFYFDSQVRTIGALEEADKIIALTDRMPGCRAKVAGSKFECKCGNVWDANSRDWPVCIKGKAK